MQVSVAKWIKPVDLAAAPLTCSTEITLNLSNDHSNFQNYKWDMMKFMLSCCSVTNHNQGQKITEMFKCLFIKSFSIVIEFLASYCSCMYRFKTEESKIANYIYPLHQ